MSLPLMNYQPYASLTSSADYFKKMHDFLNANGWTINEFRNADSEWTITNPAPSLYGWKAGTESFLDIEAPAACHVGTQHYRMNLQLRGRVAVAGESCLVASAVEPNSFAGEYEVPVTLTGTATYAEVTFASAHGLVAGNTCYITGMGITGNDIKYRPSTSYVVTVLASGLTANTFRYTITGAPANSPALGSPLCARSPTVNPAVQTTSHIWGPRHNVLTLPTGSFTGCWFFENGYSFWSVIQPTVGTCFLWGFGTPNLSADYYGTFDIQQVYCPCQNEASYTLIASDSTSWYSGEGYPWDVPSFGNGNPILRFDGTVKTYTGTFSQYYNLAVGRETDKGYFDNMFSSLHVNSYNTIRPAIVPDVYVKRAGGYWECCGTLPLAKLRTSTLTIGQELDYGAEKLLVFPNLSPAFSTYGTAFRIL